MTHENIPELVTAQRNFFNQGSSKPLSFRITQLKKLKQAIINQQEHILEALYADLHKPRFEAYTNEIYTTLTEINYALKNIHSWTQPQEVTTPFTLKPAKSFILHEPRGLTLIMAPWNFPFQLIMIPLIGAIAAGNCIILKPSEHAPFTAKIILEIINKTFDHHYIKAIEGGVSVAQNLLKQKWDYIFFTGSTQIGKIVMQAATEHLTPITLELGGKNPCIVHNDVDIATAAQRITWGKFLNAGQSCVAPDYILAHEDSKQELINAIKINIKNFYGENPFNSTNYGRIINNKSFDRLIQYVKQGTNVIGGEYKKNELYIAPTILDNVDLNASVMQEEIFGPILPIIAYTKLEDVINFTQALPKSLAVYIFTNDKKIQNFILDTIPAGGACINDVLLQASTPQLPFGGVGRSGFGRYHGKYTFETFSNKKAIFQKTGRLNFIPKYPPYNWKHNLVLKILKWINK